MGQMTAPIYRPSIHPATAWQRRRGRERGRAGQTRATAMPERAGAQVPTRATAAADPAEMQGADASDGSGGAAPGASDGAGGSVGTDASDSGTTRTATVRLIHPSTAALSRFSRRR